MRMSSPQRDPIPPAARRRGPGACVGLLLLAAVLTLAIAPRRALADPQFFRIGTGVVDSPSFAVAGIVAAGLSSPAGARPCERGGSCGVPNLIALAQAVGSPTEAVDLLEQRQIDAALVPASDAYRTVAPAGGKPSAKADAGKPVVKPRDGLRTVATLYIEALHVIVRDGTRFETIDDLKRRTVVTATDDPTAASFLQSVVSHLGLEAGRKTPPLAVQAALQRLADGQADALIVVATPPAQSLVEFNTRIGVRLLSVPPAASAGLPYLTSLRVAGGFYLGADDADMPALPTQLLVSASADPARIEAITRALWNESTQKLLAVGPPAARAVKFDRALTGITIPLHPGAARVYREAGLLTDKTPVGD
jgi:TRAP transporter TAXI family solute receptor